MFPGARDPGLSKLHESYADALERQTMAESFYQEGSPQLEPFKQKVQVLRELIDRYWQDTAQAADRGIDPTWERLQAAKIDAKLQVQRLNNRREFLTERIRDLKRKVVNMPRFQHDYNKLLLRRDTLKSDYEKYAALLADAQLRQAAVREPQASIFQLVAPARESALRDLSVVQNILVGGALIGLICATAFLIAPFFCSAPATPHVVKSRRGRRAVWFGCVTLAAVALAGTILAFAIVPTFREWFADMWERTRLFLQGVLH